VGDIHSLVAVLDETRGKVLRKWSGLNPLHKAASVGKNIINDYNYFNTKKQLNI
jgi:hypothetical protein